MNHPLMFVNIWTGDTEPTKHKNETEAYQEVLMELSNQGYGRSYEMTLKVSRSGGVTTALVIDYTAEAAQEILNERNHERSLLGLGPVPAPRDPMLSEE